MTHKIAKLLLEKSDTFLERAGSVKAALGLGMPLSEIEEYLDWLDMVNVDCKKVDISRKPSEDDTPDVD